MFVVGMERGGKSCQVLEVKMLTGWRAAKKGDFLYGSGDFGKITPFPALYEEQNERKVEIKIATHLAPCSYFSQNRSKHYLTFFL